MFTSPLNGHTYPNPLHSIPDHLMVLPFNVELAKRLLDITPVVLLDCNGMIRHASPTFCTLIQRDSHDLTAADCGVLFAQQSRADFLRVVRDVSATNNVWTGTVMLRKRSGVEFPAVAQVLPQSENNSDQVAVRLTEIPQIRNALRPSFQEPSLLEAAWLSLPGVVLQLNLQGKLVRWNENFERVTGYPTTEIQNKGLVDFFKDAENQIESMLREVFRLGHGEMELNIAPKSGENHPYILTMARFSSQGEQGLIALGTDISDRMKIEESLREKSALFEAQVESSLSGILVTDSQGSRIIQNERLNEMWNIPPAVASPQNLKSQLYYAASQTKNPSAFLARVAWLTDHPDVSVSDEIELLDGRFLDRHSGPVLGKDGHYYGRYWTHRDVTSRKEAEKRIRYLATHDSLTSLPNRSFIQEKIGQTIFKSEDLNQKFALLFLNLDRFKVINDGYGNAVGDAVLKETSHQLLKSIRECDIIARYGGDEFIILLNNIHSAAEVQEIVGNIIDSMSQPFSIQDRRSYVSASIGVSIYPQDGETVDNLIGNANIAMNRAKELGRNNTQYFTQQMSEAVQRKINVETRLRTAAANSHLSLIYQPKVSLEDGHITGCEALMRWDDPELGTISPAQFIPIAEESGLIVQLGDWALRTACLQAKKWLQQGLPPICVAVNVSSRQFLHQSLYDWVLKVLNETELSPSQLEIELTESLLAQDVERALVEVSKLREAGIKFSIDDFGTGYSSLSYLSQLSVDTLKIDQSFVNSMLTNQGDANIVRAIINLAHSLGFRSIAEGVETIEQCDFLRLHGCEEMQGYYFSRPISANALESMLRANKQLNLPPR